MLNFSISPRAWYIGRLTIILLAIFLTAYSFFPASSGYKRLINVAISGKKSVFVESMLSSEIDGPFNNKTLIGLCQSTTWTPGLIFRCESPEGGVANVRNALLNCVRYTILAGATGFVLPEILIPFDATTGATKLLPVSFSHYFDTVHFTSSLSTYCPQIKIYSHINDLYDFPTTSPPIPLTPASIPTSPLLLGSILSRPSNWTLEFRSYLNKTHPAPPSALKPLLISVKPSVMEFPLSYDTPSFIPQFGRLIRARPDIRHLAATILYALSSKHGLDLDFPPSGGITSKAFLGVHLRTGPDAVAAGWTNISTQSENYISQAANSQHSLIYVAGADGAALDSFISYASTYSDLHPSSQNNTNIQIETAPSLLGGHPVPSSPFLREGGKGFESEWTQYRALSWDQALLVDYEVLLRASQFAGTWESAFSWNVMMRRHIVVVARSSVKGEIMWSDDVDLNGRAGARSVNIEKLSKREWSGMDIVQPLPQPGSVEGLGEGSEEGGRRKEALVQVMSMGGDIREKRGWKGKRKEKKESEKVEEAKAGDVSWKDELSIVFGPVGEGRRFRGSLWP